MKLKPNGEVLKWSREISRKSLEDVADKLSVTIDLVRGWEENKEVISYTNISRLSAIYQRPIPFFFLANAPKERLITPEFRTFDSVKTEELSEKALMALRKSKHNRNIYLDLLERLNEPYKFDFPKVSLDIDPENFAKKIRSLLNIPTDIHLKLKDKSAALRYWITTVEAKGVLIFQYSLDERGFCLHGDVDLPPIIVLSSGEEPAGRIFTIIHELAHILIKDKSNNFSYSQLEKFCNHFSGALLVPEDILYMSHFYEKFLQDLSDFWLSRLAGEFKVSQDVILRRLLILNKISNNFYEEKIKEIKSQRDKKLQKKKKDIDGFLPPAKKSFMNTGITLSSKLFEARDRGIIGTTELVRDFHSTSNTLERIKLEVTAAGKIYADQ